MNPYLLLVLYSATLVLAGWRLRFWTEQARCRWVLRKMPMQVNCGWCSVVMRVLTRSALYGAVAVLRPWRFALGISQRVPRSLEELLAL